MKILPPDDPTAVYPIGSLKNDDPETPAPEPVKSAARGGTGNRPVLEPVELTDDALNPLATPAPRSRATAPSAAARSPLVLGLLFGGAGMLLAAALLGILALFFYATQ